MLKICLASDNHGDLISLNKILCDHPDCDYYFHMGDSCLYAKEITPFISVKGNNDYCKDYPLERIIELNQHRILITHGTYYANSLLALSKKAKANNCDVLLFGHIHEFVDEEVNKVRLINPGSTYYNRDGSSNCYAIMYIKDDNKIEVERINLY